MGRQIERPFHTEMPALMRDRMHQRGIDEPPALPVEIESFVWKTRPELLYDLREFGGALIALLR
ncbi:hypothetical protein D3C86_1673400 [compost metagenome]